MAAREEFGCPYNHLISTLIVNNDSYQYYDVSKLDGFHKLPFCLRIILESIVRNCDGFQITRSNVDNILNFQTHCDVPLSYKPTRVIFQDLTCLPAIIDLACVREALERLRVDPSIVNPKCLVDILIEHPTDPIRNTTTPQSVSISGSIQKLSSFSDSTAVDESCSFHSLELEKGTSQGTLTRNQLLEFERNKERFLFLKWGSNAFKNIRLIPPGSGFMHQMNLEYLSEIVINRDGWLFPDSLIGTDSHTSLVNGLGVLAFGVGAIEAEAVVFGQSFNTTFPQVVGCKLVGHLNHLVTSTDVVLAITKSLRQSHVSGKYVEFFGSGVKELSMSDRMTIANMCQEYALIGYFPIDTNCLQYLALIGKDENAIVIILEYLKAMKLLRDFTDPQQDPVYSQVIEIDLETVISCCSGPKRQQDRIPVTKLKTDFLCCLENDDLSRGYAVKNSSILEPEKFTFNCNEYSITHGDVMLAAIASCTNATNPSVMMAAGLLAKKAFEAGLRLKPFVKASLSPGNTIAVHYLKESKVIDFLQQIGFSVVGYSCPSCFQNSNCPLASVALDAIKQGDIVAVGVLAGSRSSDSRNYPAIRANYLMSPMLVVAYALAGTVVIDFDLEPIGSNSFGMPIFLRDIWPSREDIMQTEQQLIIPSILKEVRSKVEFGTYEWDKLEASDALLFPWNSNSTYIKCPPFLDQLVIPPPDIQCINDAFVLLNLGNDVSTDHISPAGSIARNTPAARFLTTKRLTPREFNSYGSRRGNDEVMARSTFANIHLENKFLPKPAPKTLHFPSGVTMDVFDVAERYRIDGHSLIVLAGRNYGCGSSRDWAAKGLALLGIRAIIAESFDENHRASLVGAGILPLQFLPNENSVSLGLTGRERFTIPISNEILAVNNTVEIKLNNGRSFSVVIRLESEVEVAYYRNGGILKYAARQFISTDHVL